MRAMSKLGGLLARSRGHEVLNRVVVETLEQRQLLSSVAGAYLFYNNSAFDGKNPAINAGDDAAIAIDKTPLKELQKASFANYSSYDRGLNGLMIDIAKTNGTPTLADFTFRAGNANTDPFSWATAPAPSGFVVRKGAGVNGSDRIVFIWDDALAVKGKWLQVTVLPTNRTGVFGPEVFYFGSAVGETGNRFDSTRVDATDQLLVRSNQRSLLKPAIVTDPYDFNRDKKVDATDQLIARSNQTTFASDLKLIAAPLTPANAVRSEVFSPSEVRLTWLDNAKAEAGYAVMAAPAAGGMFTTVKQMPANSSAALLTGLEAGQSYQFKIVPLAPAGAPAPLPVSDATIKTATPERLRSGDNGSYLKWYKVSLPSTSLSKNEAGYQGSGSASLQNNGLVQAESPQAAVFLATSGSATITNKNNEQRTYNINNSGAYQVGTVGSLTSNSGFDKPSGMPDDQYLLVLEDTYEWTNIDRDYDDFYWKIDLARADVQVRSLPEETATEPNEVSPGAFLGVNDDDDNGNRTADKDDLAGVQDENDLVAAALDYGKEFARQGDVVILSITGGGKIKVWSKADKSGDSVLIGGSVGNSVTWTVGNDSIPDTVYIEGTDASASVADTGLKLEVHSGGATVQDEAKVTVVKVQIQSSFAPYVGNPEVSNLLGAWPDGPGVAQGDTLPLNVKITPTIQNLPGGWTWNVIGAQSMDAADNKTEIHVMKSRSGTGHVDLTVPSIGVTKTVWIDFPDVGTQAEEAVWALDPATTADVLAWGYSAQQYASNLQAGGLDGQRANAIQHAYWNALITYFDGASNAALYTTAHEYSNRFRDAGLALDSVMDLHNNEVGRSIAVNVPQTNWLANVQAELNTAAHDGRLWIIDTKTNEVIRSDGQKIFR